MLKNYFKIALRNLVKYKAYSFINIAGLATGIACCIIILLYIQTELSYDRYHENADNIYRITEVQIQNDTERQLANTFAPVAPALQTDYPELEIVRFYPYSAGIEYDTDKKFQEDGFFFADSNVFKVFTFNFIAGDENALKRPNTIVLTESTAKKYFGNDNPVGKILRVENKYDFEVTGVIEDVPANSHFSFDVLASFYSLREIMNWVLYGWYHPPVYTYALAPAGFDAQQFESMTDDFIAKHIGHPLEGTRELKLQKLTDIHLHSNLESELQANNRMEYIYLFAGVAFFVLMIACINFMNLATARSESRAKEVGLRKVIGAERKNLIGQFLGESLIYSVISTVVAIGMVELVLPFVNSFFNLHLSSNYQENWYYLFAFIGMALFVGFAAGMYPALFLSSFKPAQVIKGRSALTMRSGKPVLLRSTLVVFQFAISIVLIIVTLMMLNQLDYLQNKGLGFDKEQTLVIPVRDETIQNNLESFKNRLLTNTNVKSVSATSTVPGIEREVDFPVNAEGMPADAEIEMKTILADYDFVTSTGLEVTEGRNFSKEFTGDFLGAFIINRTAVEQFGWDDPIGKSITMKYVYHDNGNYNLTGKVVGVVKDFHFRSLHHPIAPVAILLSPYTYYYDYMLVKAAPGSIKETISFVKKKWNEAVPHRTFDYTFLDEEFAKQYKAETQLGKIFTSFALLTIMIACLGLFGLSSFIALQRTKEIGIRKTLGATVSSIVYLLTKDFAKPVLIANIIAIPVGYWAVNKWLEGFAYKIDIGLSVFVIAAAVTFVIAIATVSYQAVKASLINPSDSLRYE